MAVGLIHLNEPEPERRVRRFSFTPDSLAAEPQQRAAISPDGRWVAYVSGDPEPAVWLRAIDREEPRKLEGTEGARRGLFWSPDSEFIGFADDSRLNKVSIQGGPKIALYEPILTNFIGGSWNHDGG